MDAMAFCNHNLFLSIFDQMNRLIVIDDSLRIFLIQLKVTDTEKTQASKLTN